MDGLERLIQKIETESKAQAAMIVETAKQEAEGILASAELLAETERAKLRSQLEIEIKTLKERKSSRAALSARDEVLKAKRDILESVYDRAQVLLDAMEGEPLYDFMLKQIKRVAADGTVTVIMNARTASQLPNNALERVQRDCAQAGMTLEVKEKRQSIPNGFQLLKDGVVCDFTYAALIGEVRETAEPQLAEMLFKGV